VAGDLQLGGRAARSGSSPDRRHRQLFLHPAIRRSSPKALRLDGGAAGRGASALLSRSSDQCGGASRSGWPASAAYDVCGYAIASVMFRFGRWPCCPALADGAILDARLAALADRDLRPQRVNHRRPAQRPHDHGRPDLGTRPTPSRASRPRRLSVWTPSRCCSFPSRADPAGTLARRAVCR
jgi:hypothetical protein